MGGIVMHVLRVRPHSSGQEASRGSRREVGGYPLGKEYLRSFETSNFFPGWALGINFAAKVILLKMAKERRWRGQGAGCLPPV